MTVPPDKELCARAIAAKHPAIVRGIAQATGLSKGRVRFAIGAMLADKAAPAPLPAVGKLGALVTTKQEG